jgi:hypothetical protein
MYKSLIHTFPHHHNPLIRYKVMQSTGKYANDIIKHSMLVCRVLIEFEETMPTRRLLIVADLGLSQLYTLPWDPHEHFIQTKKPIYLFSRSLFTHTLGGLQSRCKEGNKWRKYDFY